MRKKIRFKSIHAMIAILLGLGSKANAQTPIGLVGGKADDNSAYAAFVFSSNLDLSSIAGMPAQTNIRSVSINGAGQGLIGGNSMSTTYAAYILSDGTINPIPVPSLGFVSAVAINQSGFGLIGGYDNSFLPYAAQTTFSGGYNQISLVNDAFVFDLALNNSNLGLIVGTQASGGYAAYISSNGIVTPVPTVSEEIDVAAINDQGTGIIGGYATGFSAAYAAFVTPDGASPVVINPLPLGVSVIQSVAINKAGLGLIGGLGATADAIAGYAQPNGDFTSLFNPPQLINIRSVALNDSGIGLIGGNAAVVAYAAFVRPDGTVTPLFDGSVNGAIDYMAINNAGLGLMAGTLMGDTEPFVTLIAPDGTLTRLNLISGKTISSIDLAEPILNQATPQAMGPYGSAVSMQLAAHTVLENRFVQKNKLLKGRSQSALAVRTQRLENELAYNEFDPNGSELAWGNPKQKAAPKQIEPVVKPNSIWLEPFGALVYLKEDGTIPSMSNEVGGVLLGYDREGDNFLVGTTLGYGFNYVDYASTIGHAKVQEETASLYGAYYGEHVWIGLALWGGFYQVNSVRHTDFTTSKGKTHGWILDPHVELAAHWALDQKSLYSIEPFVQFDWVNNWQKGYTESGSSGLNAIVPSIYNSLLQSEAGLRFYERFVMEKGDFFLEEKISYVNQAPFGDFSVNTAFVSSASTFPIAVASSKVQNLGAVQVLGCFVPNNTSYPYAGFSAQATVGSSYQSYFVSVFTGVDF